MTEIDVERGVPEGWAQVRVDEVGDVQLGRQRSPKHHHGEHMRPYLRVANVYEDRIDTSDVKEMNFTPEEFERYRLGHGDILLNEGQSPELVGRPAMFRGEVEGACFQNTLVRFRADEDRIEPKYALYYFLDCLHAGRFTAIASQTVNIAHLGAKRFSEMILPLAPRHEQRRIVDTIEELFSDLNAGVEALETVRRQLDRYRQSILKAAVEGDLTREWRQQNGTGVEPAGALLERILDERRARWEADYAAKYEAKGKTPPKGWQSRYQAPEAPDEAGMLALPNSWEWVSLDALTQEITSGPRNWSPFYDRGDGVFVMAQNVRPGQLDLTHRKRVDPPDDDPGIERSQIERDDLLVTIVGANTGDVCRVDRDLPRHYVCQSVALMRPVSRALGRYLNVYLNSAENGQRQWRRYIYGAGRPHLSFDQLRMTGIALPPLAEQEAVVEEVERRLSVVDAVAAEVGQQLARAGRLRRAILQHAFEGKLVEREPQGASARAEAESSPGEGALGELVQASFDF